MKGLEELNGDGWNLGVKNRESTQVVITDN